MLRLMLRLVPRRHRFSAALVCARLLTPVISRTAYCRSRRKSIVDSPLEISLYLILAGLTREGISYEPCLRITGFDLFEAKVKAGRGVLLISGHNVFGFAILNYLAERGYKASLVSYTPDPHRLLAPGVPTEVIAPNRSYLLQIRNRFRNGEVVGAMIDRSEAVGDRTFPVATAGGTVHLADALIEVATHAKAGIIFLRASVEEGAIEIELTRPRLPEGDAKSDIKSDAKSIARDFAQFLQSHILRNTSR